MSATHVQHRWFRWRSEAGQALIEFALGLTLLVLLILGIVDLSRMAFAHNVVASAAREGARYAAVHKDASQAQVAAIAKDLVAGLDVDELQVTLVRGQDGYVQVDVTYSFHATTPWMEWFLDRGSGSGVLLRGRSVMRQEER